MDFVFQYDQMDCGPACLSMISSHYGRKIAIEQFRREANISKEGVSLLGINEAAQTVGFETLALKIAKDKLSNELLPCILHWKQNHFVILKKIKKSLFRKGLYYEIVDPGHGIITLNEEKFSSFWLHNTTKGIVLTLKPSPSFFSERKNDNSDSITLKSLFVHFRPFKKQIAIISALLLFSTLTSLILPYLTQMLFDNGVNKGKLDIVLYVLTAQLLLFLGNLAATASRNWVTLVMGTKINLKILSQFITKMLKLPIHFFETKVKGDFNQRIQDHERIDNFLTSQSLQTFFSIVTFSVFFIVLANYDLKILILYTGLTACAIFWSLVWLRKLKVLDYMRFQLRSDNQESIYEMLEGISEMKLFEFDDFKKNEWENLQHKLYEINFRILRINQFQNSGFEFLNQLKNILVTFVAAYSVINGDMTLGMLLGTSFIVGQMNSPINQLITFFSSLQEAKLSFLRLNEVQNKVTEEDEFDLDEKVIFSKEQNHHINFKNVSFQYEGKHSPFALKNVNLLIEPGKITAIVGSSGSGKSTLMKLMLKFYLPTKGDIFFNSSNLINISPKLLRDRFGVVMQDGFIFSDSILRNIVTKDENPDEERLIRAIKISNLGSFLEELPMGLKTKIGSGGKGLSGGQKQRILIARAVYKDPDFIFFDEATSSLDSENESIIHCGLQDFFKNKTVIIIAHRLSTVKKADKILVVDKGEIVEEGNHRELVQLEGKYFNLVKNQLELSR